MVVKNESLSKQTMKRANYEEDIRRIMGMNDVNSTLEADINAQEETRHGKIQVLQDVPHQGLEYPDHMPYSAMRLVEFFEYGECGNSIDMDAMDFFVEFLSWLAQGYDHHWVPSLRQRVRFVPNS